MLTPVSLPSLDHIPKPILIPVPINLEYEPPILDSHIPLIGKGCEFQVFDLEQTLDLKLTLEPKSTLELILDLSHILESVLVLVPFTLKPKYTILTSHILLLDQDKDILTLI